MLKIYAIFDNSWYPLNAINSFKQYSVVQFVDTPDEADFIWVFSYYEKLTNVARYSVRKLLFGERKLKLLKGVQNKPIMLTIHHLDETKEELYLSKIKRLDAVVDCVQFFSQVNIEHSGHYFSSPILRMPYWLDLKEFPFYSGQERQLLRQKFGLPEDKIVIGSFQRDTEGKDLKSPKLVKGPDILCNVIRRLPKEKVFVALAGPRRQYVEGRLNEMGVDYKNFGSLPHDEVAKLYGAIDYYLVTSRLEGGPQAILESMATGTKLYSTKVGVSDLLEPSVICETEDQFVEKLNGNYPDVLEAHRTSISAQNVEQVIKQFEVLFEDLVAAKKCAVAEGRCLSEYTENVTWC